MPVKPVQALSQLCRNMAVQKIMLGKTGGGAGAIGGQSVPVKYMRDRGHCGFLCGTAALIACNMAHEMRKTKTIAPSGDLTHGESGSLAVSSMRRFVQRQLSGWLDFLVPTSCPLCRTRVRSEHVLCAACWRGLKFITGLVCARTGAPMALDFGSDAVSLPAQINPPPYHRARAALAYEGNGARLVRLFKFGDRPELAAYFAPLMLNAAGALFDSMSPENELSENTPVFVPVPLHRRRLLSRRFNQSAELCRALRRLSGHDCLFDVLRRARPTRQQIRLSRSHRQRNLRGAFALNDKTGHLIKNRPIVLVDDVLTTGATVEACTKTLLRGGAAQVNVLTIARVVMPERLSLPKL